MVKFKCKFKQDHVEGLVKCLAVFRSKTWLRATTGSRIYARSGKKEPWEYKNGVESMPTYMSNLTSSVAIICSLVASEIRAVLSSNPVASVRPSGLKATLFTPPAWPLQNDLRAQYSEY